VAGVDIGVTAFLNEVNGAKATLTRHCGITLPAAICDSRYSFIRLIAYTWRRATSIIHSKSPMAVQAALAKTSSASANDHKDSTPTLQKPGMTEDRPNELSGAIGFELGPVNFHFGTGPWAPHINKISTTDLSAGEASEENHSWRRLNRKRWFVDQCHALMSCQGLLCGPALRRYQPAAANVSSIIVAGT